MRLTVLGIATALAVVACRDAGHTMASVGKVTAPSVIDFGDVFAAESVTRELELTNVGRAPIYVRLADLPSEVRAEALEINLESGATSRIQLVFQPSEPMILDASLRMVADTESATIALKGRAYSRTLVVQSEVDFGTIAIREKKNTALVLIDPAPLALAVTSLWVCDDPCPFSSTPARVELEPSGSAILLIDFEPAAVGDYPATLLLRPCEGCAAQPVTVSGRAVKPALVAEPDALDFGPVSPGHRLTKTFLVRNCGEVDASLASFVVAPLATAFTLAAGVFPVVLEPGQEIEASVTFAPSDFSTYEAQGDGMAASSAVLFTVRLTGQGGGPEVEIVPSAIDFGIVPAARVERRSFSVLNVGLNSPKVFVTALTLDGTPDMHFAITDVAVPVDVTDSPWVSEVQFHSDSAGEHNATLIVDTSEDDEPTLRVPLRAHVVDYPTCSIVAADSELAFGLVDIGVNKTRATELRNIGDYDCWVWGLRLGALDSPHFSVLTNAAAPVRIAPHAAMTIEVAFHSDMPSSELERANLYFTYPTAAADGAIELTAWAGPTGVEVTPDALDFGTIQQGDAVVRSMTVRNVCQFGRNISRVVLGGADAASFRFLRQPRLGLLPAGESREYVVVFNPSAIGVFHGGVQLTVDELSEPLITSANGEAVSNCPQCNTPTVTCPSTITATVNTPVTLAGAASDPGGGAVSCNWTVIARPVGSTVEPHPATACTTAFVPDVVGIYQLELVGLNASGFLQSCTATVNAEAPPGLWVEMYWFSPGTDLDLYMQEPEGCAPTDYQDWFTLDVCCFATCVRPEVLDWAPPGPAGDPSLERDSTLPNGTGPENIRVAFPTAELDYAVGVHWFDGPGSSEAVRVNVFCGSVPVSSSSFSITRRRLYVVGSVRFSVAGGCSWTPLGIELP